MCNFGLEISHRPCSELICLLLYTSLASIPLLVGIWFICTYVCSLCLFLFCGYDFLSGGLFYVCIIFAFLVKMPIFPPERDTTIYQTTRCHISSYSTSYIHPSKKRWSNPITGLYSHWGCQKFEAPTFQDTRHMKVVRLSALRTGRLYTPGNIPGTHFC